MRKRIDLRTLFRALDDPTPSDGLTDRIMQQVAAAGRPGPAPAPRRPLVPFPRWARLSPAVAAVAAVAALAAAWLAPVPWLGLVETFEASFLGAVWIVTLAAGMLAEGQAVLGAVGAVGEAVGLVRTTPAATLAVAIVTLLCLAALFLLHRLPGARLLRSRGRGVRIGPLLLVGGLSSGLAFAQPPQDPPDPPAPAAQEAAADAIDQARERLDEALQEADSVTQDAIDGAIERLDEALQGADEAAQDAIEGAIEQIEEFERDLARRHEELVDVDNKVAFGSTVRVSPGEVADSIVSIGGGVKSAGEVHGDAVSIGGEVSIDGRVTGDVVAVGGDVELGPDAEITGDVVSIGGEVQRETGAVVHGDVVEMAWADMDWEWGNWFGDWDGDWFPSIGDRPSFFRLGKALDFVWAIVFTGVLIALAGLVLLIAPRGVDRVRSAVVADPWILLVVGIGVEILLIPVLVVATLILLVTVIGIPFAVLLWPVAFVAFALALVLGYTGSAAAAGEWCRNRFRDASRVAGGSFGALALGVLTIQALALAADLLGFLGLPWFFRVMFWFPGFLICYAAWTIGLGGVVMTRFGSHGYGETAPASPPPAPAAPGDAGAAAGAADAANEPPPGDGSDESPAEPPKPPTA